MLGSTSSVSFAATVIKLCYRVLAPLFVGQLTQYWLPSVAKWAKKHKPKLKKLQEHLLTFIVYVTFVKRSEEINLQAPFNPGCVAV